MKKGIYRAVVTTKWDDPWHQELSVPAKALFDYCITNHRQTACGVFEANLRQIAFETGIPETKLGKLFEQLAPKVQRWPAHKLYFVRNFYQYQRRTSGPDFTTGAIRAMQNLPDEVKRVVIEVYQELGVTTNAGEGKTSTHEIGGWDRGWDGTSVAEAEQQQKQNSTAAEAATSANAPAGLAGSVASQGEPEADDGKLYNPDDLKLDNTDWQWARAQGFAGDMANLQADTQKWRERWHKANPTLRVPWTDLEERWQKWVLQGIQNRGDKQKVQAGGTTELKINHSDPKPNRFEQYRINKAQELFTADEYERWCAMSEVEQGKLFRQKLQEQVDLRWQNEATVSPDSQPKPSPATNGVANYSPPPPRPATLRRPTPLDWKTRNPDRPHRAKLNPEQDAGDVPF